MTSIIENIESLTEIMTTTPEEDKQFLNKVKEEINEEKIKRPRGRPAGTKKITEEEVLERRRACDKRRYDRDPQKKIQMNREWRQRVKLLK